MDQLIYLNNAATSYPKPSQVQAAVQQALIHPPGDASRGVGGEDHRHTCRQELAKLFAVPAAAQVSLQPSATVAINQVVHGLYSRGAHVVSSALEHNSVLRPLSHLERQRQGRVSYVEPADNGRLEPTRLRAELCAETAFMAITQVSNVSGAIQPVADIAAVAAEAGVPLLIDASQGAGMVPLDYDQLPGRVFVAFAGHKGLLGPTGTGGLILPDDNLPQSLVGGTGVRSEAVFHPGELPLRHEAGTPNFPGVAGLLAGVRVVCESGGVRAQGAHRQRLVSNLRERLLAIPEVWLLPLPGDDGRAGIVSFTLAGWGSESLAYTLRESFGIETRSGLHCAPRAHIFFGTGDDGAVRVSFGSANDDDDLMALLSAINQLVGH